MTDYSQYGDFLAAADADDRVGHQVMIIDSIVPGSWPSGDQYVEFCGRLETARLASHKFSLATEIPTPAQLKELAPTMDRGRQQGIARSIRMRQVLEEKFGFGDLTKIPEGAKIGIVNVKNKQGFIRTVAIVPLESVKANTRSTAASDAPPF